MNRVICVLLVMLTSAVLSDPSTAQDAETLHVALLHQIELPAIQPRATHVVAWSPDGSTLAIGGDEYIRLYDADTLESLGRFEGHRMLVTNLDWSPDGNYLASGSPDDTVRIWNVEQQESILEFTGHEHAITDLEWQPEGNLIASSDLHGLVQLWHPQTGQIEHSFQGLSPVGSPEDSGSEDAPLTNPNNVLSISWHPAGIQIAAAVGGNGGLQIWDAITGEMVRRFATENVLALTVVSWNSNGMLLAIDSLRFNNQERRLEGDNQLLNALMGDIEARLNIEPFTSFDAIKWSPDGRFLATNSLAAGRFAGIDTLVIWDTTSWQPIARLESGLNIGDPLACWAYQDTIAWSPDSTRLASVGEDGLLRMWQIVEG